MQMELRPLFGRQNLYFCIYVVFGLVDVAVIKLFTIFLILLMRTGIKAILLVLVLRGG